jgi:ABC-type branched-subunit amino acid transport system substrate-binding protein
MARWRNLNKRLCAVAVIVAIVAAACGSSSHRSSANTGSATGAAGPSKSLLIDIIVDDTGPLAPILANSLPVVEAAFQAQNATGGIHGYQLKWKAFDSMSTPAGGVAAAREAIADHPFAILAVSYGLESGLGLIAASGIPAVSPGETAGWTVPHRPTLFAWEGDLLTENTTSWMKYCVDKGHTKFALVAGSNGSATTALATWAKMVPIAGGRVVFYRVGINSNNTADTTATAHQIKGSGANCILNLLDNSIALQPALNALGATGVIDIQAADVGPSVTKAYGTSADGVVYGTQSASPYDTADPGVAAYLALIKKYAPSVDPIGWWEKGYTTAVVLIHALQELAPPLTQAKLMTALNSLNAYTADGLSGPITFPEFHTNGQLCLSFTVLEHGTWIPSIVGPNPFICGQRYGSPEPASAGT